jgi:hypothetical protein
MTLPIWRKREGAGQLRGSETASAIVKPEDLDYYANEYLRTGFELVSRVGYLPVRDIVLDRRKQQRPALSAASCSCCHARCNFTSAWTQIGSVGQKSPL